MAAELRGRGGSSGLATARVGIRIFDRYVVPEWQDRNIEEIEKGDVTALLNKIGDGRIKYQGKSIGTPFVARSTRAQLSTFFNWYIEQYSSDKFRSPIVKSRQWGTPRPRDRHLQDDEIRALWKVAARMGTYGAVVKTALLTAQRFHTVSAMQRLDVKERILIPGREVDGEWVPDSWIEHVWDPTRDDDPKNKQVSVVPLSAMARRVINEVPILDAADQGDWVFSLNGQEPIKGWSKLKDRLNSAMLSALRQQALERGGNPDQIELRPWQHRDLRRTAKTLMMRAGVSRDISEHCLAHAIGGVEGVYDRYDYLAEKREAFTRLAALVERIVHAPEGNVVPMRSVDRSGGRSAPAQWRGH